MREAVRHSRLPLTTQVVPVEDLDEESLALHIDHLATEPTEPEPPICASHVAFDGITSPCPVCGITLAGASVWPN